MSDFTPEERHVVQASDGGTVRRQITPDPESSEYDLLEILAELEGCDIEDLPSLYNEVEHVVETLFKTPPSTAAQMSVTFSYAGYRISIDRNGTVQLVDVKDTI